MKIIGYAYPSSTLATKLKRGKTGCFYVADVGDTFTDESNFVVAESFSTATEMCKGHVLSKWSQRDPEVLAREMRDCVPLENSVFK